MDKNTLFFSHSSKDKDAILLIKDKIMKLTGSTLNIFMSSDGQSIPFGRNWVSKVESGLNEAKIMFVFVTETSLSSGWIYFETGFAYSKGIQVVPVGIGIDIGALKPPLNLLQGFNLTSEDSLNNFISIINETFNYKFEDQFTNDDYLEIINSISNDDTTILNFENIVSFAEYSIRRYNKQHNNSNILTLDNFFEKILLYLQDNNISFSKSDTPLSGGTNTCIVVCGIMINYLKIPPDINSMINRENESTICFKISSFNFQKSFELFKTFMSFLHNEEVYINFHFRKSYKCITSRVDCASKITSSEKFELNPSDVESYICDVLNLQFSIYNGNRSKLSSPEYVLNVIYSPEKISANDFFKLISWLNEIKLIYINKN